MMRAMYAGVAGLRTHQSKMDVIGNNIANVNTAGFKASTVIFNDVFYQTTQASSGANDTTGKAGINAKQIGLGSTMASITKNIKEPGGAQTTNDPFHVMINGDAFFIVKSGGTNYFTKNGAFMVDGNGTLCTATGAIVQGWQVDPDDPTKTKSAEVSDLRIMSPENLSVPPEKTDYAYMTGNIDKKDTQIAPGTTGKNFQVSFYDNLGYYYTAKFTMTQTEESANAYNVQLKDIVDSNNNSIFLQRTEDGGEDGGPGYQVIDELGVTLKIGEDTIDLTPEYDEDTKTFSFGEQEGFNVIFNGDGGSFSSLAGGDTTERPTTAEEIIKSMNLLVTGFPEDPFSPPTTGEEEDGAATNGVSGVDIDFSYLTMYSGSGSTSLESTMGDTEGRGKGKTAGEMTGISIDSAGKIYASYSNSDLKLLGQIAVASFSNPSGLESIGDSLFKETQNSGRFNGVGQDPTDNGGSLSPGIVEMSNVDLSSQFTDMITTQRGFQANSRIITTSDTLLEELINLKR